MIQWQYPHLAFLLVVPVVLVVWFIRSKIYNKPVHIKVRAGTLLRKQPGLFSSLKAMRPFILLGLQVGVLVCLILAAMNPFRWLHIQDVNQYGVDIVLCLDVSESMTSDDLKPSRLEASKAVLADFINSRATDRLGLVIFGSRAYVQSPQTVDYDGLLEIISTIESGSGELGNKTAIGDALAVSGSRLLDSKAKTRLIVLITDGEDNTYQNIRPESAADALRELAIKVYSVGIGTGERVNFELLKGISETTGGKFYQAKGKSSLVRIMNAIDQSEKSIIGGRKFRRKQNLTAGMLWAAFTFLFLYLFTGQFVLPDRLN